MALTTLQIINIAKVSQYLADEAASKGSLFTPNIDKMLGQKLYVVRKDLEWLYNLDPTNVDLFPIQTYLYNMCDARATAIVLAGGSGGSGVVPGTVTVVPSPIRITGANFTSATAWDGANSNGITIQSTYTLQVFWNDIPRFLEPSEWTRTATGITVNIAGFDATTTNIDSVFYIYISV
jgi:hypothetical protein